MSGKYNIHDTLLSLGYKYIYQESKYKCYQRFNKINNIAQEWYFLLV